MRRLREHNVIHFDLRLANFIVSITRPLRVAVIDFALSRIRDEDETDERVAGGSAFGGRAAWNAIDAAPEPVPRQNPPTTGRGFRRLHEL